MYVPNQSLGNVDFFCKIVNLIPKTTKYTGTNMWNIALKASAENDIIHLSRHYLLSNDTSVDRNVDKILWASLSQQSWITNAINYKNWVQKTYDLFAEYE